MIGTDELTIDLFCGSGGASEGIRLATGRDPDIAINHNAEAIAAHKANHPGTHHVRGDVWHSNPREVCGSRRVGLLWASPTCVFFSQAKGGPLDHEEATKVRALAWVVNRWAREVRPRVIVVENVPAFQKWGPLLANGQRDLTKSGRTFRNWVGKLKAAGYQVEWRELVACDYGAPTSRKRLFIIARCDGQPIVWPTPTHGPHRIPHRAAAECINWSLPVPSIFGRKKALSEATLRRIARGIQKFVIENADPFLIPTRHGGDDRVYSIREPLRTVTGSNRGEIAFVAPTLITQSYGEREGQAPRVLDIEKPIGTVVAGGIKHALAVAFLAKNFGGHETPGQSLRLPLGTITCKDHHALVTASEHGDRRSEVRAFLTQYNGQSIGQSLKLPLNTVTTKDRFGLVTVAGHDFAIADIGMRLLVPRELSTGQGFRPDYEIAPIVDGKTVSKTAQVRMIGNGVPPHFAQAIVSSNLTTEWSEVA